MFGQFPLFSATGLAFALVIGLLIFFVKLYRHRMMFRKLPGPPHSFWFGHMPVLSKLRRETLPKDSHGQIWMDALRKKYNLGKVFYLDSWPLDRPIMVVLDPEIANIITTKKNLPKDPDLMRLIGPVLGPESLVVQHGQRWKSLRMMFNPGFSPTHLMTLAPMIVDTTVIFYNVLRAHAEKGDIFLMDEAAVNYTIDIIGKVAMNVEFNAQTTDNEVVGVFRTLLKWLPKPKRISPFNELHPKRIYILWKNVRYTNKYLGDLLESRFLSKNDRSSRSEERTVIDLALNSYLEMNPSAKESKTLDPRFKISAIDQLKSFLFAGHDTSGTMIAYAFHLLAKNPEARARMCKELDEVLDPDMALSAKEIKENPHILNNLPYTTAVLKETLRLYPPASSMRTGSAKGDFVTDPETHAVYPTYGFRVWPVSHGMGRDPDLFPDPSSFRPERFLLDSPFAPRHKDAWRPFEKGPRNCIGQELAMLEGRIAMALTARYFGFKTAYPKVSEEERRKGAPLEVDGEQCYQILAGVAKPKAGMPCRVWKVKQR